MPFSADIGIGMVDDAMGILRILLAVAKHEAAGSTGHGGTEYRQGGPSERGLRTPFMFITVVGA